MMQPLINLQNRKARMKISKPSIYGYGRKLSFVLPGKDKTLTVELKYTGTSSSAKGVILDNEIIPFVVEAVNSHDDLVLTLKAAIERVRMANNEGDAILSAWREDAEKLLAKLKTETV